ncbi:hypothetical protein ACN47E_001926 [Coniothyrium glycines]
MVRRNPNTYDDENEDHVSRPRRQQRYAKNTNEREAPQGPASSSRRAKPQRTDTLHVPQPVGRVLRRSPRFLEEVDTDEEDESEADEEESNDDEVEDEEAGEDDEEEEETNVDDEEDDEAEDDQTENDDIEMGEVENDDTEEDEAEANDGTENESQDDVSSEDHIDIGEYLDENEENLLLDRLYDCIRYDRELRGNNQNARNYTLFEVLPQSPLWARDLLRRYGQIILESPARSVYELPAPRPNWVPEGAFGGVHDAQWWVDKSAAEVKAGPHADERDVKRAASHLKGQATRNKKRKGPSAQKKENTRKLEEGVRRQNNGEQMWDAEVEEIDQELSEDGANSSSSEDGDSDRSEENRHKDGDGQRNRRDQQEVFESDSTEDDEPLANRNAVIYLPDSDDESLYHGDGKSTSGSSSDSDVQGDGLKTGQTRKANTGRDDSDSEDEDESPATLPNKHKRKRRLETEDVSTESEDEPSTRGGRSRRVAKRRRVVDEGSRSSETERPNTVRRVLRATRSRRGL